MKFGIFYEHQLPRPWDEGAGAEALPGRARPGRARRPARHRLRLGGRAPLPRGVLALLGARGLPRGRVASARRTSASATASCCMPPGYNHPARVAERIATLDLVSNGRVEFGTGESASRAELEGFGIDPAERRAMWREVVEQVANMLAMDPVPGLPGQVLLDAVRNVVPKPVQKPHPPLWVACSNRETIHLAAQLGLGALTFAFVDPAEAQHWVDDYYETFKRECVPIGHAVNPNIAMVSELLVPPGRGGGAAAAASTASASSSSRSATSTPSASTSPGRTDIWEQLRGRARPSSARTCSAAAPAASARRTQLRDAPAQVRGRRRRPGGLHPAGRQEPARAHLRGARALREAT